MKIQDAAKENFVRCTRNELRAFCREVNIKIGPNASPELMRKELLTHFKIDDATHSSVRADRVIKFKSRNDILPPYNLTPEGLWGGRRRRIKLGKPMDATKSQRAELVSWNGKNPYRVPFNEVEAVPEPIYNRLREIKRSIPMAKTNEQTGEVSTEFLEEPKFSIEDYGPDPDTAHLCGNLREWYQDKGPKWLRKRSLVELQQIADHCQIERSMYRGPDAGKPRPMTLEELLPHLLVQFFDHPDVDEEPDSEPGKSKAGAA